MDAYGELSRILGRRGARPIVAGAGAYGLHVEFDPTKDVDIVLSKPLDVASLSEVMGELVEGLRERGWRVAGARIQLGRSGEDWVIQVFVVAGSGRVVAVEVFNLLAVRPASLYETTKRPLDRLTVETLTLESWFASKLADPNGVDDVNLRRLSLPGIVGENARDAIGRTTSGKLQRCSHTSHSVGVEPRGEGYRQVEARPRGVGEASSSRRHVHG